MSDLLYDLHLAQSIASQADVDSVGYYQNLYRNAILRKYDMTTAELDSCLAYYTAHPELLYDIYEKMAARLENQDFSSTGANSTILAEGGDTINLWNGSTHILLLSKGRNCVRYVIEADTLIKEGDELEWCMVSTALYPEGERNLCSTICMEYQDTTVYLNRSIGSIGNQCVRLPLLSNHILKKLNFTLLQNANWSDKPKLFSLCGIKLLRYRNSVKGSVDTVSDSIRTSIDSLSTTHDTIYAGMSRGGTKTQINEENSSTTSEDAVRRRRLTPSHRAF